MSLDVNSIQVESFHTVESKSIAIGPQKCTGCDSTCGIIGEAYSDNCY